MRLSIKIKLLIFYLLFAFFSPNAFADINCDQLLFENIHEIKKGDIQKTRMKGKGFKQYFELQIKTKGCKGWVKVIDLNTDKFWDSNKDLNRKFQKAVDIVSEYEQKIRDKHGLGKRKLLLMQKAQGWNKKFEEADRNKALIGVKFEKVKDEFTDDEYDKFSDFYGDTLEVESVHSPKRKSVNIFIFKDIASIHFNNYFDNWNELGTDNAFVLLDGEKWNEHLFNLNTDVHDGVLEAYSFSYSINDFRKITKAKKFKFRVGIYVGVLDLEKFDFNKSEFVK
jgi:hypothetical protein